MDTATKGSEDQLTKVAENMSYYPMAQIKLIGYASTTEADPHDLARRRVAFVTARLGNRYNIGSDRMESSIDVSDGGRSMVEIKMRGSN